MGKIKSNVSTGNKSYLLPNNIGIIVVIVISLFTLCTGFLWSTNSSSSLTNSLVQVNKINNVCNEEKNINFRHNKIKLYNYAVNYVPSSLEQTWLQKIDEYQNNICSIMQEDPYFSQMQYFIDLSVLQDESRHKSLINDKHREKFNETKTSFLSKIEFRDQETNALITTSFVEPLFGLLRDPRTPCYANNPSAYDKRPFFPENQHGFEDIFRPYIVHDLDLLNTVGKLLCKSPNSYRSHIYDSLTSNIDFPPRALLFDLGASQWNDIVGLKWLVNSYKMIGIEFQDIYAWEAKPVTAAYFNDMPLQTASKVHFYNMPAMIELQNKVDNPLELLAAVARPEDFVAFKLDIDTPDVEMAIISELFNENNTFSKSNNGSSLVSLIDEFYFEHHVDVGPMRRYWGNDIKNKLKDTYELLLKFRRYGVRAHSWP